MQEDPPATPSVEGSFGVVYVAFGAPYLAMALTSTLSLRLTNPAVPFTVVTNVPHDPSTVPWFTTQDHWVQLDLPDGENRAIKTRVDRYATSARSLYLDADTLVVGDLGFVDFELRHFDVLAFPELRRTGGRHGAPALLDGPWTLHDGIVWNGGVIAFRRSAGSTDLFDRWHRYFVEFGLPIDQPALVHALHTTSARVHPLGARFNTTASTGDPDGSVTILHYKRRGDRATRALVAEVAARFLDGAGLSSRALAEALAPSHSKRRRWDLVAARNADLLRPSLATEVRRRAVATGLL